MKSVIVTSFDENYYPYAHVSVKSFSLNYTGDKKLDYFCMVPTSLLHREAEFINKIKAENLNIKFVSSTTYGEIEKDKDKISIIGEGSQCFNRHALHRLFMVDVCEGFDKAIYIDPDTLVMRNVQPILDYPLNNKFIACPEIHDEFNNLTGNLDEIYFNDGVFITDLNFWRISGMHFKIKKYIYNNPVPQFMDQDILNLFFKDYLYPLPLSFNSYPIHLKNDLIKNHLHDPLIVHFVGFKKPWKAPTEDDYSKAWHKLYKELNRA